MLVSFLLLFAGFALLGVGAEALVSGSARLAIRMGVAPIVVGLTIVAFGTSAPELAVSIEAASSGRSALALGNIIGSNIANIGLILGLTAIICPIHIETQLIRRQIPLMIGVSVFLCLLLLDGQLGFIDGIILLSGLLGFLLLSYFGSGSQLTVIEKSLITTPVVSVLNRTSVNIGFIIGGLGLLIVGSHIFVESAISLAQLFGVSEAIIGLTVVAVGTSVPELATSVVAALRKQSDIAMGNIVGSNLFNILGILGITAVISSIAVGEISIVDFAVMIVFACALLPMAWSSLTLSRTEGSLLLAGYAGYITFLVVG